MAGQSIQNDVVRIGLAGLGNIGQIHKKILQSKELPYAKLAAICSRSSPDVSDVPNFTDFEQMCSSGLIDAVLIATPTMLHPEMGRTALAQGLHVLMEKPLAMSVGQAQALLVQRKAGQVFAVMLNQRFHPHYSRIKSLIDSGAIGRITRIAWTMTAWYRPDIYYQASSWRGTWPGEGGGLLINQCIHNLDVLQWFAGLPSSVSAIVGFGKHHNIDVEDEFTATLGFANGATGVVIASSGEAPGINQLDIVGDLGMLRFDGQTLKHWQTDSSIAEHCETTDKMFGLPQFETSVQKFDQQELERSQHVQVIQNFVDAIVDGKPLLTSAEEGLNSLHLANGILQSAWSNKTVTLPIESETFEQSLQARVKNSNLRTPVSSEVDINMEDSYR